MMKHTCLFAIIIMISIQVCLGQFSRHDSVTFLLQGDTLRNACAGGLNSPQFSQIDLNGDGIKDLIAFERNWEGRIKTFLNGGLADSIDYTYAPEYQAKFPQMRNWVLLADYNCDGREDLFTSVPAGMAVYRNDFDMINGLEFTKVTSLLYTEDMSGPTYLYVATTDIPAIADIDNDGDLDILSFSSSGSTVEYHKNYSMENYGNCDSLDYVLEDLCWGQFQEDALTNTVTLGISCKTGKTNYYNGEKGMHAGSAILALDIDSDLDKEVILGDLSFDNMVLVVNGGDPANANMTSQDINFPSNNTPVNLSIFPAGFHIDVNNDGKKDLLVAPNNPNASENFTSVWYYENTGLVSNQPFEYRRNNFLQNEMIDMGAGSNPVFFDYNSDSLLDILIGNETYYDNGNNAGKLTLLENIGTANNPVFNLITRDYSNVSALNTMGTYPSVGDMDNDGDVDMLLGDYDGILYYFENTAGPGNTASFSIPQSNYMGIDVGQFAAPQIIDVNRDGKLDLLIGERSGKIIYFENIGTPAVPFFNSVPTNDYLGEIDMMIPCCTGYSSPYMAEDSSGSYILYVGSETGYIYRYNNIEGNLGGKFALLDSFYTESFRVSISGADINTDNETEFLIGEYFGGIAIYKEEEVIIGLKPDLPYLPAFNVFPNPASSTLTIKAGAGYQPNVFVTVEITDLFGKIVETTQWDMQSPLEINLSQNAGGLYVLTLRNDQETTAFKLIKL